MLITTGILLGVVLLVMVGEQAQEMQLAHCISTTPIAQLVPIIPKWAGLWFSVYPTYETLVAQGIAAVLVVGSYYAARKLGRETPLSEEPIREAKAEADIALPRAAVAAQRY
jgi:high-affinity iron transporter